MPDWSVIEPVLSTWVADITGLPVHYRKRPRAMSFSNDGYVLLDITGIGQHGFRDDLIYEYDAGVPGGEYTYYQSGHRVFTLGVQVRTWRTSVDSDARTYTTLIRDALRLPIRTTQVFQAANIAVASVLSETSFDAEQDGREMSVAQIDVRFNATSTTADTPHGYIAVIDDAELEVPVGTEVWIGDITVG